MLIIASGVLNLLDFYNVLIILFVFEPNRIISVFSSVLSVFRLAVYWIKNHLIVGKYLLIDT